MPLESQTKRTTFTNDDKVVEPAPKKLRIPPGKKGSGIRDVSVAHDRYLAEFKPKQ